MNAIVISLDGHRTLTGPATPEEVQSAKDLRAKGLTFGAIGRQLGRSHEWARTHAAGIQKPTPDGPEGEKRCGACRKVKPLSDCYGEKHSRDGKKSRCRACFLAVSNAAKRRLAAAVRAEAGLDAIAPCRACGAIEACLHRRIALRLLTKPRGAEASQHAPDRLADKHAPVPHCVCGHREYFHTRGSRRACACEACPAWMERGL